MFKVHRADCGRSIVLSSCVSLCICKCTCSLRVCWWTVGENAAEAFTQQGKMVPIILTVTVSQVSTHTVCMCITAGGLLPINPPHVGDKEPHQATARSGDHLEWFRSLSYSCFRAREQNNAAISFIFSISHAFNSHRKHNYRHTEKSLCQTACCTVEFSPVPPLIWARFHFIVANDDVREKQRRHS